MKEFFEIVTLHDCAGCNNKKKNLRLRDSMGPVEIILGGWELIKNVLGIFGGSRRLTSDDWRKLFPAQGPWTTRLRNYLASHITWDTDTTNIQPYTENFIHENLNELSNGKWSNLSNTPTSSEWATVVRDFYNILTKESQGIIGNIEAGIFGGDMGIIPLLLIGGLVFSFMSKKTSRKKKT